MRQETITQWISDNVWIKLNSILDSVQSIDTDRSDENIDNEVNRMIGLVGDICYQLEI